MSIIRSFIFFVGILTIGSTFIASSLSGQSDDNVLAIHENMIFGVESVSPSNVDNLVLRGRRSLDATMRFGQLIVSVASIVYVDIDQQNTFVPYNFAYQRDQFTSTPAINFPAYDRIHKPFGSAFSKASSVITDSCINPRPDTNETESGIALKNPLVCEMQSSLPNSPTAMVGIVQPVENARLADGGRQTCAAEATHWMSLPAFADASILFCVVVDLPFGSDSNDPTEWMDVIVYQIRNGSLMRIAAEQRNRSFGLIGQ